MLTMNDQKFDSRRWLVAYTRCHHEQTVARQFEQKQLECLLPTFERVVRWSDRVKRSRAPLFPGYVFVHSNEADRLHVLQTEGVIHVVSRAGKPVPLSEEEIARLHICCSHAHAVEPHPFLKLGRKVRVKHGPFSGWEGTLVEKHNSRRLVINIEQIMKSVVINLDGVDVEALN
jgi:transcription antitermination factor NusG